MRMAHPALRTGAYQRLYADADVYAFARADDAETLVVAVNVTEAPRSVVVPIGELFVDGTRLRAIYGEGAPEVVEGQVKLELPARDGNVLGVST